MAVSSASLRMVVFLGLVVTALVSLVHAHSDAAAPAPAPSSDGTSIDQGVAYVLMLLAFVLTFFSH